MKSFSRPRRIITRGNQKKKSKLQPELEKFPDNRTVSNVPLMSFGERVKKAAPAPIIDFEITDEDIEALLLGFIDDTPPRIKYYEYRYDKVELSLCLRKFKYMNHFFQCDVSRLPPGDIEQYYKKTSAAINYREKIIADHSGGKIYQREVFRSNRLFPEQRELSTRLLHQ